MIGFDTFMKVLMRADGFKPAGTYDEFINGFKVFDKENDGCITVGELRSGKDIFIPYCTPTITPFLWILL